ncbi:hypothetical protein EV356DRAFT_234740 [Viridothelium virens]|uniref:Uncharacterized protein n=1 Tax=Viridothelium virens TaxID=1048519 RepID=A0A6A6H607_VIRVR|nr:hypothetical protein EV356DRAFT_234740 [Viridothelium virens]
MPYISIALLSCLNGQKPHLRMENQSGQQQQQGNAASVSARDPVMRYDTRTPRNITSHNEPVVRGVYQATARSFGEQKSSNEMTTAEPLNQLSRGHENRYSVPDLSGRPPLIDTDQSTGISDKEKELISKSTFITERRQSHGEETTYKRNRIVKAPLSRSRTYHSVKRPWMSAPVDETLALRLSVNKQSHSSPMSRWEQEGIRAQPWNNIEGFYVESNRKTVLESFKCSNFRNHDDFEEGGG